MDLHRMRGARANRTAQPQSVPIVNMSWSAPQHASHASPRCNTVGRPGRAGCLGSCLGQLRTRGSVTALAWGTVRLPVGAVTTHELRASSFWDLPASRHGRKQQHTSSSTMGCEAQGHGLVVLCNMGTRCWLSVWSSSVTAASLPGTPCRACRAVCKEWQFYKGMGHWGAVPPRP